MITERMMDEYANKIGWDDIQRYELALEYIERQQDTDTWADFLYEKYSEELTDKAMAICEASNG